MIGAREGPRSLFEKLWDAHCVTRFDDGSDLLAVDVLFLHERTGSVALESLQASGRSVRHPERVWCTMDHIVNTRGDGPETLVPNGQAFLDATRRSTRAAGIRLLDLDSVDRGIVHVVSPELGIVHPGHLLVCPDSHTCSQGALGALAWGIGSTEAEQVLATQTLRVTRPANLRVDISGEFAPVVSAKDLALGLIARFGAAGAAGRAIEFTGEAVRAMSIEARLTLCNLAVEFGAFTAIIAPDATTFAYLRGRRHAPARRFWDEALRYWRLLASDEDAVYEASLELDARTVPPMLSWGTSPQHSVAVDGVVPDPRDLADANARGAAERALDYMQLLPGERLLGKPIDVAFIGSCTNGRLEDLRAAAELLRGRRVAAGVEAWCVPGSRAVKREAEAQGLDRVFREAGFQWREPGCSLCFYAGGEGFAPGARVLSTTNRNFEGRQGPRARTHLASPATVAASAVAGCIADPRPPRH